jgi:hypothetical protein
MPVAFSASLSVPYRSIRILRMSDTLVSFMSDFRVCVFVRAICHRQGTPLFGNVNPKILCIPLYADLIPRIFAIYLRKERLLSQHTNVRNNREDEHQRAKRCGQSIRRLPGGARAAKGRVDRADSNLVDGPERGCQAGGQPGRDRWHGGRICPRLAEAGE